MTPVHLVFLTSLLVCFQSGLFAQQDWLAQAQARIERVRKADIRIRVRDSSDSPLPSASVKVEQTCHQFAFGTAIAHQLFDPGADAEARRKYLALLQENFNWAVHENALKWYRIGRRQGLGDYDACDRILDWCQASNIKMRGHCIFWANPRYNPGWVRALSAKALRDALEARCKELVARYRGRILEYDVNNEMLRQHFYADRLGETVRLDMFRWARANDPEARLFVNDYGILGSQDGTEKYKQQIEWLLDNGAPLGGIGLQGHFSSGLPPLEKINETLDALAELGLPIRITEFDIACSNEAEQARALSDFFTLCFSHPAVEGIIMWGFWEGAHWKPERALYRKDFSPKLNALAYRELVFDKWWTREKGQTDERGIFRCRGFFGNYRVTWKDKEEMEHSKAFTLNKEAPPEEWICQHAKQGIASDSQ